jgi:hypothetical protein
MQELGFGTRGRSRLALLAATALLVVGCGGSASILSTVGDRVGGGDAVGAPIPAGEQGRDGDATSLPDGGPGKARPGDLLRDDLKIVYTGSLQLVVADLVPAVERGRTLVAALGGYVGASREANDGDHPVATITYRIPASRWEDGLAALRGLATKVVGEETQATEVGTQIVDLEARIRNLRASETALVGIAESAAKVSDLLEVQARISEVRGQIEQLDAQRTQLTDQVAYGTLVTTYGLEVVAVEAAASDWDPAREVDQASATLLGIGQALATAGIWFGIVWLPFLVGLAVLVVVARMVLRRAFPGNPVPRDPIPGWTGGD